MLLPSIAVPAEVSLGALYHRQVGSAATPVVAAATVLVAPAMSPSVTLATRVAPT